MNHPNQPFIPVNDSTYGLTISVGCPGGHFADILVDIDLGTSLSTLIYISALTVFEFISVGARVASETAFSIDTNFRSFIEDQ